MNKKIYKQNVLNNVLPYKFVVALIDLENVANNYRKLQKEVTAHVDVSAVVKADAYGFGAANVSKKLSDIGCKKFFVATIEEGIEIRNCVSESSEIYVLSGVLYGYENIFEKYSLIPVLTNIEQILLWIAYGKQNAKKLPAVIHVDTGMSRNGLMDWELDDNLITIINNAFDIKFIMSHLACAEEYKNQMNVQQLEKFTICKNKLGIVKGSLSATNGVFLGSNYHFDIIRPGKSLYGFAVRKDKIGNFEPVMDIYSRIVQINHLEVGNTVGYGATFVAQRKTKTITIGMGYADGFMRKFSAFGCGFLNGHKIPIIGRISMDYVVLDITDLKEQNFKLGDFVCLTNSNEYTLENWALDLGTIPHEVSCSLGRRCTKIYI